MSVSLTADNSLYAYNGSLVSLLGVDVAFSVNAPVSGEFTDDDGTLNSGETSTVSIAGGADEPMTYIGTGTATGLLGLTGTTHFMVFSVGTGLSEQIYLYAPDGFPAAAGLIVSLNVDTSASFDLSPSTDAVDGTSGDDVMDVGFTDPDGDEITDYDEGFLGIGYQSGEDEIYGYAGNDWINGGSGDDIIDGGTGNDTLLGGDGDDTIYGGDGNDTISGGTGKDTVYGGDGNDTWLAGDTESDSDVVYLQGGDDYAEIGFFTTGDPDVLDGGDGVDTLALDNPIVDDLDSGITLNDDGTSTTVNFGTTVNNFENVRGSSGDNVITGNFQDNIFWGLDGEDTLDGGAGNDTIDGGAGADTMFGGDGDDTFIIGSAADADGDVITGGSGPDDTSDMDEIDLSAIDRDSYTITATEDPNDSGALTGTVNFDTGEVLSFSGIEIICFAAGTEIITSEGPVKVEDLEVGNLVLTMDHGMLPLRWMGSQKLGPAELAARPKLKPIRIAAGALGNGVPTNDLFVSRQHRVLLRSVIAERMFGVPEILVAAIKLTDLPGIDIVEDAQSVEYFHMLFDQHEIVFSNGAATESLFTGPEALKAVSAESRAEILDLFPDIETQAALIPARQIVEKGTLARKLVARHVKNNKALIAEPQFHKALEECV
ncbi:Hint domain-containing protein [Celeribacter sp.]|uniref:Hint domain-containing protein n=1 Tax=Celeribacter sp. TaxID=1890673 RepID=UPI003A947F85